MEPDHREVSADDGRWPGQAQIDLPVVMAGEWLVTTVVRVPVDRGWGAEAVLNLGPSEVED